MIKEVAASAIGGTYVELRIHPSSMFQLLTKVHRVLNKFDESGFKLVDPRSLHVTAMYSTENIPKDKQMKLAKPDYIYPSKVMGTDMFGKDKDVLVLKLESPELQKVHKKWKKAGGKPTWPDYQPHITLSMGEANVPKKVREELDSVLKDTEIKLYREQAQPIKKDWS
ncbi:hypothetical protein GR7B_00087 [Vibrio phage vB_VcorM_GR7B]|nr:hypothetical protein GR7B_00087 [Vibrio phage vB_VcorM_GR7B]